MSVSTDSVGATDTVGFWTDLVCQHLVQVECSAITEPEQFHGTINMRRVAHVDISQVVAGGQRVTRTAELMAKADREYFLLNIQREGTSLVQQDGREAILNRGDMALYSSARRYDLLFNADFRQTVLIFPADALRITVPGIDALTATTLDHENPTSKLLTLVADGYFQTEFETLSQLAVTRAANALTEIFAATVAEFSPKAGAGVSNLTLFHLTRIKQFVTGNLHDPELSVNLVSQALRISPSHIHRLFEVELQTFSTWLWSQRLLACKQALDNPAKTHLSVSEIAFSAGFNNASHFSRTFRLKFGVTPREWRNTKMRGLSTS